MAFTRAGPVSRRPVSGRRAGFSMPALPGRTWKFRGLAHSVFPLPSSFLSRRARALRIPSDSRSLAFRLATSSRSDSSSFRSGAGSSGGCCCSVTFCLRILARWWGRVDSNHRSRQAPGLQPGAIAAMRRPLVGRAERQAKKELQSLVYESASFLVDTADKFLRESSDRFLSSLILGKEICPLPSIGLYHEMARLNSYNLFATSGYYNPSRPTRFLASSLSFHCSHAAHYGLLSMTNFVFSTRAPRITSGRNSLMSVTQSLPPWLPRGRAPRRTAPRRTTRRSRPCRASPPT